MSFYKVFGQCLHNTLQTPELSHNSGKLKNIVISIVVLLSSSLQQAVQHIPADTVCSLLPKFCSSCCLNVQSDCPMDLQCKSGCATSSYTFVPTPLGLQFHLLFLRTKMERTTHSKESL